MANVLLAQECTNCVSSIQDIAFTCNECPNFKLCLQCYVCRVEIGQHKSSHPFKVANLTNFSVFTDVNAQKNVSTNPGSSTKCNKTKKFNFKLSESPKRESKFRDKKYHYNMTREGQLLINLVEKDTEKKSIPQVESDKKASGRIWKIKDEIRMLDLIDRFGYGNWDTIAKQLKCTLQDITASEVANHYLVHYVLTDIGEYTCSDWKQNLQQLANTFHLYQQRSPPLPKTDPMVQLELDDIQYLPKRNDFTIEFDDLAEEQTLLKVCSGTPSPEDAEIARKHNLLMLFSYNQRLARRMQMKLIVRNYDLVSKFIKQQENLSNHPASSKKPSPVRKSPIKSKSRKQLQNKTPQSALISSTSNEFSEDKTDIPSAFSPFLRFCSAEELQSLHLNLQREYALKLLIKNLLKYRRSGISEINELKENLQKRMKNNEGKSFPLRIEENSSISEDYDDQDFALDMADLEKLIPNIFSNDQQMKSVISAILDDLGGSTDSK